MSDDKSELPVDDAQFLLLSTLFLEGHLKPDQLSRFKAALLSRTDRRRIFVDICLLQTRLNEEFGGVGTDRITGLPDRLGDVDLTAERVSPEMDDTMVLPAIRMSDALAISNDDQANSADHPGASSLSQGYPSISTRAKRWRTFRAAAIILIVLTTAYLAWSLRPAPDPASITATAGALADGTDARPGKHLTRGQSVRLNAGSMEITFDSGAKVVLRGPAVMTVDDRNAMTLTSGTMTAYVPFSALGFHVTAPGLSVVDLGTRFGVRCEADGTGAEVHVFQGSVDAASLDATGRKQGDPTQLVVGQALQHDPRAAVPVTIQFDPQSFDQDISTIRQVVPTIGTGIQTTIDGRDATWQLLSVPQDSNWKPGPALILGSPYPTYEPNDPAAKWITKEGIGRVPAGEYVYRTHINLTGFNPTTASVTARIAADNFLKDIRVNGVSSGVSTPAVKLDQFPSTIVKLPPMAWHSGVNEVDVIVMNTDFQTPDLTSPTGLKLSWTVSASPVVHR